MEETGGESRMAIGKASCRNSKFFFTVSDAERMIDCFKKNHICNQLFNSYRKRRCLYS